MRVLAEAVIAYECIYILLFDGLSIGASDNVRAIFKLPHTNNTTGLQHAVGLPQRPHWIIEVSHNRVEERGVNRLVWKWELVGIGHFKPQV